MAIAIYDSVVSTDSGATHSASIDVPASGNDRKLIVMIAGEENSHGTVTCTYNSTSPTEETVDEHIDLGVYEIMLNVFIFDEDELPGSSGTYTISANTSGSYSASVLIAVSLTGAAEGSPANVETFSTGGTGSGKLTLTPSPGTNDLRLAFFASDGNSATDETGTEVGEDSIESVVGAMVYDTTGSEIGWDNTFADFLVAAFSVAQGPQAYSESLDAGVVQLAGQAMEAGIGTPLDPGVIQLVGPDMDTLATLSASMDPGVIQLVGPNMTAGASSVESLDPGVIQLVGPDMDTALYESGPRLTIRKTSDDSFVESFEVGVDPEVDISGDQLVVTPSPLASSTGYYVLVEADAVVGSVTGYSWPGISSKTVWNFET